MYPLETDFEDIGLPDTYWGQFGDGGEADIGHVYMWPLIWTNSWTGMRYPPLLDLLNICHPFSRVLAPVSSDDRLWK